MKQKLVLIIFDLETNQKTIFFTSPYEKEEDHNGNLVPKYIKDTSFIRLHIGKGMYFANKNDGMEVQ